MHKLIRKYSNEQVANSYLACAKIFVESIKESGGEFQYKLYKAAIEDFINVISAGSYNLTKGEIELDESDAKAIRLISKIDAKNLALIAKEKYMTNIYLKQKTSPKKSIIKKKYVKDSLKDFYFSSSDVFDCIDRFLIGTVNMQGSQIDINELTYSLSLFKHNNLSNESKF